MATFMSDDRKTSTLNWLRGIEVSPPDTVYAALFLSDPGPTGMANEVVGGSYARPGIEWSAVSIDPTTHDASISNSAVITFAEATADWGTVTHLALMNAPSGGKVLYSTALTTPRDIHKDDNIAIKVGKVIVIQQ